MKLHDITAAILGMPAVSTTEEAIKLSGFDFSLESRCKFFKVYHRDLAFTVGHWEGWEGSYWVVEDHTGTIFRESSVRELRNIIKLCAEAHYNPNGVK